jgi:hypothetical protein
MFALGSVLAIDYRGIAVYSEATIRANIIFHISNILERVDYYITQALKLPPYLAVSKGKSTGVARFEKSCEELALKKHKDKSILAFVEDVQGDEEFPDCIKGMVLRREIPLLSHLAIRIRQSGAACCACKNDSFYNQLKKDIEEGQEYQITVTPETVDIKPAHHELLLLKKNSAKLVQLIEEEKVDLSANSLITSYEDAKEVPSCIGTKVSYGYEKIEFECI